MNTEKRPEFCVTDLRPPKIKHNTTSHPLLKTKFSIKEMPEMLYGWFLVLIVFLVPILTVIYIILIVFFGFENVICKPGPGCHRF